MVNKFVCAYLTIFASHSALISHIAAYIFYVTKIYIIFSNNGLSAMDLGAVGCNVT